MLIEKNLDPVDTSEGLHPCQVDLMMVLIHMGSLSLQASLGGLCRSSQGFCSRLGEGGCQPSRYLGKDVPGHRDSGSYVTHYTTYTQYLYTQYGTVSVCLLYLYYISSFSSPFAQWSWPCQAGRQRRERIPRSFIAVRSWGFPNVFEKSWSDFSRFVFLFQVNSLPARRFWPNSL